MKAENKVMINGNAWLPCEIYDAALGWVPMLIEKGQFASRKKTYKDLGYTLRRKMAEQAMQEWQV